MIVVKLQWSSNVHGPCTSTVEIGSTSSDACVDRILSDLGRMFFKLSVKTRYAISVALSAIMRFGMTQLTTRIALTLTCCALLNAKTYDVTADWVNGANPNGVWSYDQGSTPLPYQGNLGSGTCFSSA